MRVRKEKRCVNEGDMSTLGYYDQPRKITRRTKLSRVKVACQYAARHVNKVLTGQKSNPVYDGKLELDTHADTFVAGRNCTLMNISERVCDVMPYLDD